MLLLSRFLALYLARMVVQVPSPFFEDRLTDQYVHEKGKRWLE